MVIRQSGQFFLQLFLSWAEMFSGSHQFSMAFMSREPVFLRLHLKQNITNKLPLSKVTKNWNLDESTLNLLAFILICTLGTSSTEPHVNDTLDKPAACSGRHTLLSWVVYWSSTTYGPNTCMRVKKMKHLLVLFLISFCNQQINQNALSSLLSLNFGSAICLAPFIHRSFEMVRATQRVWYLSRYVKLTVLETSQYLFSSYSASATDRL